MKNINKFKLFNNVIAFCIFAYLAEATYTLFTNGSRLNFVNDLQLSLLFLIYLQLSKLNIKQNK